jgi:glycosyltransferase involved in cell wall biosynthesis
MIITALLQNRNEVESGHLSRFLKWNSDLYDNIVAYDDFSSDKSVEVLKAHGATVIEGQFKMFTSELNIKRILLDKALEEFPKTDWFLWLDADELLLSSRQELESIIHLASLKGFDGLQFPLVNLWRSEVYFRADSNFNELKNVRIWKNTGRLYFDPKPGLHHLMHPKGLRKILDFPDLKVLHFGFSSEAHIINKFQTYRDSGQRARNLWRLVDETNIELISIDATSQELGNRFGAWRRTAQELVGNESYSPIINSCKSGIVDLQSQPRPIVTLISLIYAGVDWLEFQYGELLKLQLELGPENVEILFVANDATNEVIEYLQANEIPHILAPGRTQENEWYINSVYRAYNFGAMSARGEYVLLTNSDMAYFPGFLSNLLSHRSSKRYLVGKLIESGRLKPAKIAIKKNFGMNLATFKRANFYKFAARISGDTLTSDGLYMPLLINRQDFIDNGGFPEGNIKKDSLSKYLSSGNYEIAEPGEALLSGDFAFVERSKKNGWEFLTLNSAIAYHFQEGEKSEHKGKMARRPLSGINLMPLNATYGDSNQTISEEARLRIVTNSSSFIPNTSVILLTNNVAELQEISPDKLNQITSVVTSDIPTLILAAIQLNIHAYFIDQSGLSQSSQELSATLNSVISAELRRTFLPSIPSSLAMKIRARIPAKIKIAVRPILKFVIE